MKGKLFEIKCECGSCFIPTEYEMMSVCKEHDSDYQEWKVCCPSCGIGHRIRLTLTYDTYDPDDIDIWEEVAHQLGDQHSSGWVDENTGGGTMVFYKNYLCIDGKERMIGVNEESIGVYDITYQGMYDDPDVDMSEVCIDFTYTDYPADGAMCDISFLSQWLDADQIEDVRIGQWMYIKKHLTV